jgi:hypothetical protein
VKEIYCIHRKFATFQLVSAVEFFNIKLCTSIKGLNFRRTDNVVGEPEDFPIEIVKKILKCGIAAATDSASAVNTKSNAVRLGFLQKLLKHFCKSCNNNFLYLFIT